MNNQIITIIIAGVLGIIVGRVIFTVRNKTKTENNFWSRPTEKKEENKNQPKRLLRSKISPFPLNGSTG